MITATKVGTEELSSPQQIHAAYIWGISLAGALGGLLFGYDWVVIGGAKPFYEKYFALTSPSQQGWAMSCALVGCLAGALVSGRLSDGFGRKRLLIASALLFIVTSVGTALANIFSAFVLWRMLGGVAIGSASSLAPMYISEISPAHLRGRLVSLNQLAIVIGILLAQFANWLIAQPVSPGASPQEILSSWNGQAGWRWMFGVTALPSALFLILMFAVPESPRWLAKRGLRDRARQILTRIGGREYANDGLAEIEATLRSTGGRAEIGELFQPRTVRAIVVGVALAVLQQWCGINVIFNYAEEIFSAAGYQLSDILFNIVITGAVNLVFTFVAIGTVDKFGRRVLMLIGTAGLAVIYTLLGALYHAHRQGVPMLLLVVAAIACYAMSLAPVTWVVISEIFPNKVRGAAMSVAVTALWSACFVLTYTFPLLSRGLGAATTFWIYAGICASGFAFIWLKLPETRQKSLEQIEEIWAGQ